MRITVNGEERETSAHTLAALCAELGVAQARIATAHNGEFVSEATRAAAVLTDGDFVEVLSPRQGG